MKLLFTIIVTCSITIGLFAQKFDKGDIVASFGAGYFRGPLLANTKGRMGFYIELESHLNKGWSLAPVLQYGTYVLQSDNLPAGYSANRLDGFEYNFGFLIKKQILGIEEQGLQVGTGMLVNYYSEEDYDVRPNGYSISSQEGRDFAIPLHLEFTRKLTKRFYLGIRTSVVYTGSSIFDAFNVMPGIKLKL